MIFATRLRKLSSPRTRVQCAISERLQDETCDEKLYCRRMLTHFSVCLQQYFVDVHCIHGVERNSCFHCRPSLGEAETCCCALRQMG